MTLPANFQQINTNIARSLGLISDNEQAGGGLVDSRLITMGAQNPAILAAYTAQRKIYDPTYNTDYLNSAITAQKQAGTPINQLMSNNVQNPQLPVGTQLNPTLMQNNPNENIPNAAPLPDQSVVPPSPMGAPPQISAGTGIAPQVNSAEVAGLVNPNAGQMTATHTTDTGGAVAAQGTVNSLSTVQGQLSSLYSQFNGGQIPPWAIGAMTKANEAMAARGISNSSLAGVAIVEAVQQQAINIAAPDAATYFQMDLKNLDNQQQVNLTNAQFRQQNMLTDTSIDNATAQFNATNAQQTQQFVAGLVGQIQGQNADRTASMEQFNVGEQNKMAVQNFQDEFQVQQFNKQQEATIKEFNSQLSTQRDQFNSTMQFAVDQSNVLWRRTINTANTATVNAANQTNVQNLFNLSNQSLNNLWQQWRDEASWNFTSSQNAADRNFNLVMSANNQNFLTNAQSQQQAFSTMQQVGAFVANLLSK